MGHREFTGYGAYVRWLDGLPLEFAQTMRDIDYEDIYPTQTETLDVDGQIEELINLCHSIGYQQVLVTIDTSPFPSSDHVNEIYRMLGWLEPMQHAGLKVVMALPPIFQAREILLHSRGRVSVIELGLSKDHNWEVISRYLAIATDNIIHKPEEVCEKELLKQLDEMVIAEFGSSAPGAWVKLIEILLELADEKNEKIKPLGVPMYDEVRGAFFTRHMPLRKATESDHPGVWRGYKFISLDRMPYDFLDTLFKFKGKPVDHVAFQTSKENLHTIARRLRVAIEPDPSEPIYLKSSKGEGYWLENFIS